ncbi:unnamed protein product [Rotaria socialis]|uniref:Protein zer-1 homolog-like C-terminal domain-containing protein n=1 Tax=Rotaria socialis TaxID=392032 RepID=A0A820UMI0_9BILA|nr:unnamed protein product [Rotaria socialis]
MNEPLNLTEIGIRYLSKCLLPIVANENAYIPELSCLSQRLGNLLLKTIIKFRRTHLSETTDCFLSLFNNAGQNKTIKNFTMQASIAGLLVLKHKLDFLGLFDVDERGSARRWLPAKKITGEHTEEMIITSLSYYMERPSMVTHIMAHLFRLYNHYTIQNPFDAGKLVMDCMAKHLYDRSLQTSGSACLYYVVDLFQNESDVMLEKYNDYLKRLLVAILNAMSAHLQHSPMIRNGLLTISRMQMHVPNHIMSAFEQTVLVLIRFIQLYLFDSVVHEQILLHNALSVLNHVACSVDGQEKLFIGRVGAIEIAMGIIRRFLMKKTSCEIVEVAWTLLWNITDETPENCRRFIEDNDGLQVFHDCLDLWADKRDLVRNMLGLLGNVAEVQLLRHYLVTPQHMEKFSTTIVDIHFLFLAEKYCTLVRSENGEILLSQIAYSDKMSEPIKNLAQSALANIHRFHDAPVPMDIVPNDGVEI